MKAGRRAIVDSRAERMATLWSIALTLLFAAAGLMLVPR